MIYYAIPDIHGYHSILKNAIEFIYSKDPTEVIFLGDYVDRGPDNVSVIKELMSPKQGWKFTCLRGNHEQMFIDAFDCLNDFYDRKCRDEFVRTGFLKDAIRWMRKLELAAVREENVFAHAYYEKSLHPHTTLWTRLGPQDDYDEDGNFLTHGHLARAERLPNRICLDCGIYNHKKLFVGVYETGVRGPVDVLEFT